MTPDQVAVLAVAVPAIVVFLVIAAGFTVREYRYDNHPPEPDETDDERTARHVEAAKRAVADYNAEKDGRP